ncbi:MAG TPA: hypothetical protein VM286_03075 [Candidatus Thermoplasmatota archaeon]|nr:hypothetical protein [Candidatus Thermoplasmatota archaeon]
MRVLLTGATGTAGSGVLRQAIQDEAIEQVVVLARRAPHTVHPKVEFVQHEDFMDHGAVADRFVDVDAALWCLGTSQFRVSRPELHRITVDFVVAGAKALKEANPGVRFLHLSGGGADPTGRSRMPFAVEKGQAERALDALGLAGLWHLRPAYIHPPAQVGSPLLQDRLMRVLQPIVRGVYPAGMVTATNWARPWWKSQGTATPSMSWRTGTSAGRPASSAASDGLRRGRGHGRGLLRPGLPAGRSLGSVGPARGAQVLHPRRARPHRHLRDRDGLVARHALLQGLADQQRALEFRVLRQPGEPIGVDLQLEGPELLRPGGRRRFRGSGTGRGGAWSWGRATPRAAWRLRHAPGSGGPAT